LNIPLTSIPELLRIAGDSIQTDLTLREILALAEMIKSIKPENIRRAAIDESMTSSVTTPQGAMVQVADWDKVQALINELFPNSSPLAVTPDPTQGQIALEGARIELRNGSGVDTLGEQATLALRAKGYNIVRYVNDNQFNQDTTSIIVYSEKPYTVDSLVQDLKITSDNTRKLTGEQSDVDIIIILGKDYAQRLNK
jgi:hypothetical protein